MVVGPCVLGCGGGGEVSDVGQEPAELCDGSDALRFAGTVGGGNAGGVPRVAMEVGWSFLLIDGQCNSWSMTEPDGPVRMGVLSPAQAEQFAADLELGHWGSGPYTNGCFDAATIRLRFEDDELLASCQSPKPTDGFRDWLELLHASGTEVTGDVRYTVADASTDGWVVGNTTNIASPWPLASDPTDGLLERDADQDAEPRIASADDADALRNARDAYLTQEAATGPWLRVPLVLEVAGAERRYLNLALRDVTLFERDGELAVDEFLP